MTNQPVENVADYPRPPALERFVGTVRIDFGGETICISKDAWRVMETFHPPTYYIPAADFTAGVLARTPGNSMCEWKGQASYFNIVAGQHTAPRAAWTYRRPTPRFMPIKDHIAVYAEPMEACFVDGERVEPQSGNFYGGWKTSWIVGPVKGAPGTTHW